MFIADCALGVYLLWLVATKEFFLCLSLIVLWVFTSFGGEERTLTRRVKFICKRRGGVRNS